MANTASQGSPSHGFNFYGGELLSKMGASWFVSYAYYVHVDNKHMNWKRARTYKSRIAKFEATFSYHRYWLDKVQEMDDKKLNSNSIGLAATEVKRMAIVVMEANW